MLKMYPLVSPLRKSEKEREVEGSSPSSEYFRGDVNIQLLRELRDIKEYLRIISKEYPPERAIQFDYWGRGNLDTEVYLDLFKVASSYKQAIVNGIGLYCEDPQAYSLINFSWAINNQVLPSYITTYNKRFSLSPWDIQHPYKVYIVIPANNVFRLYFKKTGTTPSLGKVYARATGWYEP